MALKIVNGAWATLGASLTDIATTVNLTAGHGARFGTISSPDVMYLTLIKASTGETEHVKVTNRSTDTLTVTRAQGGSSAIAFDSGDRIECRPISSVLDHFVQYDASGNVGIGTSPQKRFHVLDATAAVGSYATILEGAQGGYGAGVSFQSKLATAGTYKEMARIVADADGGLWNGTAAEQDSRLSFFTTLNGTETERARITSDGYLLVGYSSSNGAYPLQVNGQIFATSGTIATSDGRYKRNVVDLDGALAVVETLRPVTFRWRDHPVHKFDGGEQIGFIAQEVAQALRDNGYKGALVKTGRATIERGGKDRSGNVVEAGFDEEFFGLAEGKLIPILAAAIKELKAVVDAQAARIEALEARK